MYIIKYINHITTIDTIKDCRYLLTFLNMLDILFLISMFLLYSTYLNSYFYHDYVKEEELEDIRDGNNVSYYHFCLENEDEEGQYGVYSNGILSEAMALKFSKKNF
jgi:hypothetical protein